MTGRLLKIGVPVLLLALVVTAWAANSPERMAEIQRTRTVTQTHVVEDPRFVPTADGPRHNLLPAPTMTTTRSILDDRFTAPKSGLRVTPAGSSSPIVTPITVISATTYDFQHNDDGTRQIAWLGGGNHIHFAITYWDVIPESLDQVDRYVHYNAWNSNPGSLTLGANGDNVAACVGGSIISMRAGFATVDVATGDLGTPAFHARSEPEQPAGTYSSWIVDQGFPGLSVWNCVEVPGSVSQESIWPHMSIDVGGSATKAPGDDVYHVTAHPFEANDRIYYWRRIGVAGSWAGPVCLDESGLLSYHMAPDPTSQKVSMAYLRDQENPDALLDVIYITSANNGQDWINADIASPGTCVGPTVNGGRVNITNYTIAGGNSQAWLEVTSEYDAQGRYHAIWVEQVNANTTADSRIRHWDNISLTTRTLAQAIDFGNTGGDGGRDLWLAYPQMGFGDGTTLCTDGPANPGPAGATTNNHYVYVTYEQYGGETAVEANDASVTPQQNLEVYLAVSNDHGNTWSPSVNLTNTKTPGCDGTPGNECESERDPGIAKIINDTIMVMYIRDIDAGDAVFGQGTWTYNPVQYLRIPGGTDVEPVCPQIAANFAARLSNQDPDCEYHAPRGGSQIESLTIENLGNAALTGNVSKVGGAAWLQMTTGAYTVNAGAAANVRTVTMSAAAPPQSTTEGLYSETIRITHNDPNKVSPRDIPVDFFVFDEFYCPEFLTLNTGWLWLRVSNVEEITATQDDRGGLARLRPGVGDTSWSIYDGSLLIGDPASLPDTLVYMHFDNDCQLCNDNEGFRALGNLEVDTAAYGSGAGAATAFAKQTTSDSTLGVDVTYIFPQHTDSANFVLIKYKLYNRTGSAINDLVVGQGVDFDVTPGTDQGTVQPGSQNTGHLVTNYNMVYQQGVDTAGHVIVGDNTATRYKGGMSVVSATAAPRGWIAPNDPWLFGRPGGYFHQGYLFDEMTKPGFELFPPDNPDPEEDLHSVVVFDQNADISPTGSKLYVLALVSSDVGNGDATDLTNSAKKAWKYCFGWADFVTLDSLPNNTSATYNYHAVGSHADGLGGGCTGCVITEVADAGGKFTQAGGCDGTISFNGTGVTDATFEATYRVATPCGGYQEDCVIKIVVGTGGETCSCPFESDLDGNGFIDATDLAFVIDIVFFGGTDITDPGCPISRADFDGNGFADATDLAFLIDHVFFGGTGPVNGCPE